MISELPGKHRYSSLIGGPGGVRQMDSIWDNGKTYYCIYFWGKLMIISKDNWDITEIDYDEYESLRQNFLTIKASNNNPKQYFLLCEHYTKTKILTEQTFIGLHTVSYISYVMLNQSLLCLTDCCFIIDYKKQVVIFQKELVTPCVDIIPINDITYVVCEAEILKYSVNDNLWEDSLDLPDMVKDISNEDGNWSIVLYNGEQISLPY